MCFYIIFVTLSLYSIPVSVWFLFSRMFLISQQEEPHAYCFLYFVVNENRRVIINFKRPTLFSYRLNCPLPRLPHPVGLPLLNFFLWAVVDGKAQRDQRGVALADSWNWDEWWLKEYKWKGSFLGWFVGLVLRYSDFYPALAALVSPEQYTFFLTVHFSIWCRLSLNVCLR